VRAPIWLLGVVITAALSLPALAADQRGHGYRGGIAVQGVGVVSARPDMAVIQAGVTSQATTAKAALAAHKQVMTVLLAALENFGINDSDIQSQQVNLHPVYPRRTQNEAAPAPTAFRASGNARVRLREVDRLGSLLDIMTAAGVNNLSGLRFAIAKPEPLQDQARVRAMREARRRAELYAAEAGVKLGAVMRIREGGDRPQAPEFRALTASSSSSAIAPGETEIRATVSVVYAIN
jgi:uncharacterized protein